MKVLERVLRIHPPLLRFLQTLEPHSPGNPDWAAYEQSKRIVSQFVGNQANLNHVYQLSIEDRSFVTSPEAYDAVIEALKARLNV